MNASKITVGKNYSIKVGRNEVEVTVTEKTERGWNVKTSAGKTLPINNAERFIKCLGASEELSQNPVANNGERPKISMLDAAVEVLKTAQNPMSAKELITAMAEKGLWKSPAGKTPSNTLAAAILREEKNKENPRFKKVDKGRFGLTERTQ